MEMEKGKQIQRPRLHDHPLVLVEAQGGETEKADCSVCGELIPESDTRVTCVDAHCNFHLHQHCYKVPDVIRPYPFHPKHPGLYLESQPELYAKSVCAMCKEKCKLFFYHCTDWCGFCLCIKCVFSSSHLIDRKNMSESEFKDELPFIFLKSHKDELKRAGHCSWCQHSLTGPIYVSVGCKVKLHQKCFINLPTEMGHPCHRAHTLFLQSKKNNFFCEICQKDDDGDNLVYHCLACKFDIHLECIWPKPFIEANMYHQHPFTMLCRNDSSFICDGCGTDGKFFSYICPPCHLQVHKSCTTLPRKIKAARHDHVLLHKYFLEKGEVGDCQICFQQVKKEYGSYCCWKESCNFVVHVKCVLEDDSLYRIIDDENEGEDDAEDSSITVIKKNDLGEAMEVRHFNHYHNLVLEDKIRLGGEDDRACDGCVLPVSTPFYHCLECDFFLHKACAELPRIKHHWFQLPAISLTARDLDWCHLCNRRCSGLFYRGILGRLYCLRCATIPYVIKHGGHQHFLFFDPKCRGHCSGCGVYHQYFGAFKCQKCSFSLDFACLTLPLAVEHKCDAHLLRLSYHDGNDDLEQFYCDICEEKRYSDRWYYSCSICDNSVHSECALGRYPFLKDGTTSNLFRCPRHHGCYLNYVRKVVDGYPYCFHCGKPCQDEVLKCKQCNYNIHLHCHFSWW